MTTAVKTRDARLISKGEVLGRTGPFLPDHLADGCRTANFRAAVTSAVGPCG